MILIMTAAVYISKTVPLKFRRIEQPGPGICGIIGTIIYSLLLKQPPWSFCLISKYLNYVEFNH